jgi:hypothetical protein
MAANITQYGDTMRVEWLTPIARRFASIVFFAPALYLGYFVILALSQEVSGDGNLREDLAGISVFLLLTLIVATPGYILATFRYFVDIDKARDEVIVNRTFGPALRLRTRRKLSEFTFISIVRDLDPGERKKWSWFPVNLCGGKGTRPIELVNFRRREEADDFGKRLANKLGLRAEDLADTEPDDPDV